MRFKNNLNYKIIYIAMYKALDCRQKETNNKELKDYLDFMNPYVFVDRKSADRIKCISWW